MQSLCLESKWHLMASMHLVLAVLVSMAQGKEPPGLDPAFRTQMEKLKDALERSEGFDSIAPVYKELYRLKEVVGDRELPLQLALYRRKANEQQLRAVYFVGRQFRITESAIATAIVPYLGTDDPELSRYFRKLVEDLYIEESSPFKHFVPILSGRRIDKLPELGEFMFEASPEEALLFLAKHELQGDASIKERRSLEWSSHQIEDYLWKHERGYTQAAEKVAGEATKELQKLADSQYWWVRLYVAELLMQHTHAFDLPPLVEMLERDQHTSVKRSILKGAVRKGDSPPAEGQEKLSRLRGQESTTAEEASSLHRRVRQLMNSSRHWPMLCHSICGAVL